MSVVQPVARPAVQLSSSNEADHRRQIAQGVNRMSQGQINCTLFVTLNPGASSTPVVDSRISLQTAVLLMPQTAAAATELASGNLSIVCTSGSAAIIHTNSTKTDRTFTAALLG
jgi:hypothetical protein